MRVTFLLNLRMYCKDTMESSFLSCSENFFSVDTFLYNLTSEVSFSARIFAVERITKIAGSGMSQTVEVSCAKMCQVSMT